MIYTAAGMQEDARKMEAMRPRKSAQKKARTSVWVDTRGNVHSSAVVDKPHPLFDHIYTTSIIGNIM